MPDREPYDLTVQVTFWDVEDVLEYSVTQAGYVIIGVHQGRNGVLLTMRRRDVYDERYYTNGTQIGICAFR